MLSASLMSRPKPSSRMDSLSPRQKVGSPGGTSIPFMLAPILGRNTLTKSGYPRITKEWHRGTKFEDARVVFEGQPQDVCAVAFWDLTPGYEARIR